MKLRVNSDFLYKTFIFLLIVMYMFETSAIPRFSESLFHDFLQYGALIVIAIYILIGKHSANDLIRILVLNSIGVVCYLSSGLSGLLITTLAVTLMPPKILDSVLKMILKEEVLLFGVIVALSLVGVIDIGSLEIDKGSYVTSGLSLGFSHPNMLAAQGISIILLYLCVNRNALRKRNYVISLVGIVLLFVFSKGRTAFLLGVMATFLIMFAKNNAIKRRILKILPYAYAIILCILILFMFIYARDGGTSNISRFVNDGIFNGRIGLAYRSLLVYPVTLFGKAIDTSIWNQYQYYALDNGQVMVILEFGIIGFFAYFFIIQKTLNEIKKEQEIVLGIILIVFLIWSMYEGTMYFIGKNFALLFLGSKKIGLLGNSKGKDGVYDS